MLVGNIARSINRKSEGFALLTREKPFDSLRELCQLPGLTLPYDHYLPTSTPERVEISLISQRIGEPLGLPEVRVRRRYHSSVSTVMHVKETAMHVDYLLMTYKNEIGFALKIFLVKRISITHSMNY